jgi:hypothetical protein
VFEAHLSTLVLQVYLKRLTFFKEIHLLQAPIPFMPVFTFAVEKRAVATSA